ncbi:MAG: HD domain-containing protein [Bacillota bacterium]
MKAIRDPVHNIILFNKTKEKLLLDLIDTKEFQRLRRIRQLGFSSYTYPGAEHTRFIHSLGVAHLTNRFINKISNITGDALINELVDQRLLITAAALLHDIGHGPFSHALEHITKIPHETWTLAIIKGETEVNQVLKTYGINPWEVAELIQRTHKSKAAVKLLSSQLDADRMDYLLRDSMMTGAGYGTFDLEWAINVIRIGKVNGDIEIGLDREKGLSIAEDFVMARYYMYINVYFHKTTRSAELLVSKIFTRALELLESNQIEMPEGLAHILKDGITEKTLNHYINLTDDTFWYFIRLWLSSSDGIISNLCQRLIKRKLYKAINERVDLFRLVEKANTISKDTGLPVDYLILRDEASSSSYKDYYLQEPKFGEGQSEREASEQVFLFDRGGKAEELSNISDIIRQIRNKKIHIERIYVPEEFKAEIIGGEA